MSLKEQFIAEVERKIIGPRELKARLIGDLHAHFAEGAESGESEATVIRKLGSSDDIAAEFMANIRLNYAGFWIRFVAYIIDMIVVLIPVVIFVLSARTRAFVTVDHQVIANHPAVTPLIILLIVVFAIFMGAIGILYFPVLEGLYGQTLGKRLLGLQTSGHRAAVSRARWLSSGRDSTAEVAANLLPCGFDGPNSLAATAWGAGPMH